MKKIIKILQITIISNLICKNEESHKQNIINQIIHLQFAYVFTVIDYVNFNSNN